MTLDVRRTFDGRTIDGHLCILHTGTTCMRMSDTGRVSGTVNDRVL